MSRPVDPDPRAVRAAAANAAWCATVCWAHGIPSSLAAGLWRSEGRPPPFYPDAVTLEPGLDPARVASLVPSREGASVKDSFGDVDLGALGFAVLFEAQWVWHDPVAGAAAKAGAVWTAVRDEADLAEWATAAGQQDTLVVELLGEPGVRFLRAVEDGVEVGRAALCLRVGVVEVSNVWAAAPGVWESLVQAAARWFPARPLAGYEGGVDLVAAMGGGFVPVGPLRVWVRSLGAKGPHRGLSPSDAGTKGPTG